MLHKDMKWLLLFYKVPAKPVSNRMQIWRSLSNIGALQLKGAVYVLPQLQRLIDFVCKLTEDVRSLGGDCFFVYAEKIEGIEDEEIVRLFQEQISSEYIELQKKVQHLEHLVVRFELHDRGLKLRHLQDQIVKILSDIKNLAERDFFEHPNSAKICKDIDTLKSKIEHLSQEILLDKHDNIDANKIPKVIPKDFKERLWITRSRPFIDRIASAWLIKNFIDKEARFAFVDEGYFVQDELNPVCFDMKGAIFSHVGQLCTFEVLVKAFGLKARGLKKLSEIVHQLDIYDGAYNHPEAVGLQALLIGLRNTEKDDHLMLQKGFLIMDMLYESLK